jgi:hypothetical protein
MLRRRSGRRCLWRITAGMPNRLPLRDHTRGQLQQARHTAASRSPSSSAPSPPLRVHFPAPPKQPPLCAHHTKQPSLCALLTPFPRSPLAFPRIHVILPTSPGPPSLAARLWRSFDGGVGKERTSKAIASPRAQERREPVACRQKSSRLSIDPYSTRGSPARSFEPLSKVCQEIRSKRFGADANCPSRLPKGKPPKANSPRRSSKAPQRVNPIARPVPSPVSHAGSMEVSG